MAICDHHDHKPHIKLEANRPDLRNYPHTAIDYRHTDNIDLGLVKRFSRESVHGQTDGRTLPST